MAHIFGILIALALQSAAGLISKKFRGKRFKSTIKAVITSNDMMFKTRTTDRVALAYNEVLSEREYLKKYLIVPTSKFRCTASHPNSPALRA